MRYALALVLSLLPPALSAEGSKGDYTFAREMAARPVTTGMSSVNADPVLAYVEANVTETLYHELAHALIDVLDLPIYGPEEFAADTFAVVLMNRMFDGPSMDEMARDVGQNYRIYAENAGEHPDDLALWDVHGPDMQRYYNFACLMYGADVEGRAPMLADFDLPEARAETCEDEYQTVARSWGKVLDSLATDAPFLPRDLSVRLMAAVADGAEMAQACSSGRRHPVFAIWPVAMAAGLRAALVEDGLRRIDDFTARHDCAIVEFAAEGAGAPDPFTNLNTPEDLEAARTRLAAGADG